MDESEDNKNKRKNANILSDWMNTSLERVNHWTNFEDYACSSHENKTKMLYNYDKTDANSASKQFHDSNKGKSFFKNVSTIGLSLKSSEPKINFQKIN